MGKRRGAVRSRDRDYIPFGRPAEVVIEHVEEEYDVQEQTWREHRYVERFKGESAVGPTSDPLTPRFEQGGLHPTTCKGKPGVQRTWERDGRIWCRSCYVVRYGQQPPADIVVKARAQPRSPRGPQSELERMMRRGIGRL